MTQLTYQEILDSEVDPGSPMNQSLFLRLARNWEAAFQGAAGAPRLSPGALPGTVIAAGDDYQFVSDPQEGFGSSWTRFFDYGFLQSGSIRARVRFYQSSSATGYARLYHNGALVGDWTTGSTSPIDQVLDLSIALGDRITAESRGSFSRIDSVSLGTDGEKLYPFSLLPGSWNF